MTLRHIILHGKILRNWRELKLGDIRTGGKGKPNFILVAWILVILRDALANLGCGDTHDGVGGGVVVRIAAEYLNSEGSFFNQVGLAAQGMLNDKT